jgi:hypothetical protein
MNPLRARPHLTAAARQLAIPNHAEPSHNGAGETYSHYAPNSQQGVSLMLSLERRMALFTEQLSSECDLPTHSEQAAAANVFGLRTLSEEGAGDFVSSGFASHVEVSKVAGQHAKGAAERAEATAQQAMHHTAADSQVMRQVGPDRSALASVLPGLLVSEFGVHPSCHRGERRRNHRRR